MSCMVRHVWQLGHSSFPSENTRLTRSSLVPYRSQSRPLKDGCHRWATYPRAERMDQSTALPWDAADAFWDFGLLWHTAADDAGTLGCRPSRWTKLPLQRWFPNILTAMKVYGGFRQPLPPSLQLYIHIVISPWHPPNHFLHPKGSSWHPPNHPFLHKGPPRPPAVSLVLTMAKGNSATATCDNMPTQNWVVPVNW